MTPSMADWLVRTAVSEPIDHVLAAIDHPDEPGGLVAVVHGGRTMHFTGYGLASLEAGWPWSPTTLYDIASITKTMVAQAVVRMADEGTLDLDIDLRELVPTLGELPLAVTVRNALSMRSGIRADEVIAWLAGKNGWVDEPFLHDLVGRQRSLQFEPGTWQIYSDSNYRILARGVAIACGRPFADAMRALVFDPLGLNATTIVPNDWDISSGLASYYQHSEGGWHRRPYGYESSGDGAVRTTMSDALRWLRLTLHDDYAGVPSIERLTRHGDSMPSMPYRFGVFVDSYRSLERWQHSGASGTAYVHYPGPDLTIVAFHNRDDHPPWEVIDDLSDVVLDLVAPGLARPDPEVAGPWTPGAWVDPATGHHALVSPGGRLQVLGTTGHVREVDGRLTANLGDGPSPVAVDDRGSLILDLGRGPVPFELRDPGVPPSDVAGTYWSAELEASASIHVGSGTSWLVLGGGHNPGLRIELSWYGDDIAISADLGLLVERRDGQVGAIVLSTWTARLVRFERSDGATHEGALEPGTTI